jgi:hypothetical protein
MSSTFYHSRILEYFRYSEGEKALDFCFAFLLKDDLHKPMSLLSLRYIILSDESSLRLKFRSVFHSITILMTVLYLIPYYIRIALFDH